MNPAYKHLDAKLRFAGLTLGQWAAVLISLTVAVGWGEFLHPLSGMLNTMTAVYIGGLPGGAAWFMSEAEVDVLMRVRAFARWRRGEDRFLPGSSERAHGYVLNEQSAGRVRSEGFDREFATASMGALWQ